ncbi:MAG TPA: hypothetical protein DDZ51_13375 [Planctomycetaceae bacterium]|nr:hypothetical protein [Planctomycetaceae bacterium]
MRAVLIIAFLVLILVAIGWLRFFSPDGDPTVQVDTEKVQEDTSAFVEQSKRVAGDAAEAIDRRRESDSTVPVAPRTPVEAEDGN